MNEQTLREEAHVALAGKGKGFYGHKGVPGQRGGSAPRGGAGGFSMPSGWDQVPDRYYYKNAPGDVKVIIDQEDGAWSFAPSQKGFNLKRFKETGLTQEEAFNRGEKFIEDNQGILRFRVGFSDRSAKQKYKVVSAKDVRSAERKVQEWMPNFGRFAGDRTKSASR